MDQKLLFNTIICNLILDINKFYITKSIDIKTYLNIKNSDFL